LTSARYAVTALFALTGLLCGTFTARYPALVDRFGIAPADLSVVLFVWALCAALAIVAVRRVVNRHGSAPVLRLAGPACALALAVVAATQSFSALLVATAVFGAAFGVLEIALNGQGAALERAEGRALLGGMHAAWGIGAVAGGGLAVGFGHLGVGYSWSVGPLALVALPLTVLLGRSVTGGEPDDSPARRRERPQPMVYLLAVAAFAALLVETSIADWSGLLLRHDLGTSHAVAALGYPLFQSGLLSGRLVTDRLRTAQGLRRVLAAGGAATAATFAVVASVSSPAVALLALFAVGAVLGPVLPTAYSAAGGVDGSAVALVGAAGYTGLLVGPVAVGLGTAVSTLRGGLGTVIVVFGTVLVAIAVALRAADRQPAR
jgi:fucose permease